MFTMTPALARSLAREHADQIIRSRRRIATGRAILAEDADMAERAWHHVLEGMAIERAKIKHARRQLRRLRPIRRS